MPTAALPGGRQVALPPALAPLAALFDAGQCAVVANVGPLVVPTDRTSFNNKSVPLPPKLFSHNDQQSVWQASVPEGAKFGWGGRIGDLLASQNSNQLFTCNSLTGNAVFLSGQLVQPFQIDPAQGSIPFGALNAGTLYGSAAGAICPARRTDAVAHAPVRKRACATSTSARSTPTPRSPPHWPWRRR